MRISIKVSQTTSYRIICFKNSVGFLLEFYQLVNFEGKNFENFKRFEKIEGNDICDSGLILTVTQFKSGNREIYRDIVNKFYSLLQLD